MSSKRKARDLTISHLKEDPTILLTPDEVADLFGLSHIGVRRLIKEGILPSVKVTPKRTRVTAYDLLRHFRIIREE